MDEHEPHHLQLVVFRFPERVEYHCITPADLDVLKEGNGAPLRSWSQASFFLAVSACASALAGLLGEGTVVLTWQLLVWSLVACSGIVAAAVLWIAARGKKSRYGEVIHAIECQPRYRLDPTSGQLRALETKDGSAGEVVALKSNERKNEDRPLERHDRISA